MTASNEHGKRISTVDAAASNTNDSLNHLGSNVGELTDASEEQRVRINVLGIAASNADERLDALGSHTIDQVGELVDNDTDLADAEGTMQQYRFCEHFDILYGRPSRQAGGYLLHNSSSAKEGTDKLTNAVKSLQREVGETSDCRNLNGVGISLLHELVGEVGDLSTQMNEVTNTLQSIAAPHYDGGEQASNNNG